MDQTAEQAARNWVELQENITIAETEAKRAAANVLRLRGELNKSTAVLFGRVSEAHPTALYVVDVGKVLVVTYEGHPSKPNRIEHLKTIRTPQTPSAS